jgi:hypothetical protein
MDYSLFNLANAIKSIRNTNSYRQTKDPCPAIELPEIDYALLAKIGRTTFKLRPPIETRRAKLLIPAKKSESSVLNLAARSS